VECAEVIVRLKREASVEDRESLLRYGIPNDNALGVPIGKLKLIAREIGHSHDLASELWATGYYEARSLAAFIDDPGEVTSDQMDRWVREFDSWAICDTVCFHLFDKAAPAWEKAFTWMDAPEEFVRRAGYALVWALSVHDKTAPDALFERALSQLEHAEPDSRPLVKKAMDMALRATGKRNPALRQSAMAVATSMSQDANKDRAWIGSHALRELARRGAPFDR